MSIKVNGTEVVTNDQKLTNIRSYNGITPFDGQRRGNYIVVTDTYQIDPASGLTVTMWVIDCSLGNYFTANITKTGSFAFINYPLDSSYQCTVEVTHKTGAFGWPSCVHWPKNTIPLFRPKRTHLFSFTKDVSATEWLGSAMVNYDGGFVPDLTPDPFKFTDLIDTQLNTWIRSETITVTGLEPDSPIEITGTGGMVDCGPVSVSGMFATSVTAITSLTGTLLLQIQVRAGLTERIKTSMSVSVGTGSATWSVTTKTIDPIPDMGSFVFDPVVGAEFNVLATSPVITITGLEPNVLFTITATGGEIDAGTGSITGTFGSSISTMASPTGTIKVAARQLTATTELVKTSMSVKLNTVGTSITSSATWDVTTRPYKLIPDASSFKFIDVVGAPLNTAITSNRIILTGLEPNFNFTLTATTGLLRAAATEPDMNGVLFAASQTVKSSTSGQIVLEAQQQSSPNESTPTAMFTGTIGSTSTQWTVTTLDATPDTSSFTFADLTDVEYNTLVNTSTVTVTGLEPNHSFDITVTGGAVDGGTDALSGTYAPTKRVTTSATGGLVVALQMTSSLDPLTKLTASVTIGSATATWNTTTRTIDNVPDARSFKFIDIIDVDPDKLITSSSITITGLEPNYEFTVEAVGGGAVDAGPTALSGTFAALKKARTSGIGELVVAAQNTSSTSPLSAVSTSIKLEGKTAIWSIITRELDVTPNIGSFVFKDVIDEEYSIPVTSNTVTVSGLDPNITIEVSAVGGTIDCGTTSLSGTYAATKLVKTSATGTCVLKAKVKSSNLELTKVSADVTIGVTTSTWNVTTRALKLTPTTTSMVFKDAIGVGYNVLCTSNIITVTGLEPNYMFTITAIGGTIAAGTTTIGTTFSASQTATTSSTGTLVVAAQATSAIDDTTVTVLVALSGITAPWNVTARTGDITPDPLSFKFTDVTGVDLATVIKSDVITVTGLEPDREFIISAKTGGLVDGGTAAVSGLFEVTKRVRTSLTGTVVIQAQLLSNASQLTTNPMTVTIGAGNTTWRVTTADVIPDLASFRFVNVVNSAPSVVVTSNTAVVTGLSPFREFTILSNVGGLIDAGTDNLSGTFAVTQIVTTSSAGTFVVAVRNTSSSVEGATVNTVVTIGTVPTTWSIRTADTTPNAFGFTNRSDVNPITTITSNTIVVYGLEPDMDFVVTADNNAVVDGGYVGLSGVYEASKTIRTSTSGWMYLSVRMLSSMDSLTAVSTTITVGAGTSKWTVTTRAVDVTPDGGYAFTNIYGANPNIQLVSNTVTVFGVDPGVNILVSSKLGTIDGGTDALSGTFEPSKVIVSSDTGTLKVAVRAITSNKALTSIIVPVTIGGISTNWYVRTREIITTPTAGSFVFKNVVGAQPSTDITSAPVFVTGLEPNYEFEVALVSGAGTIDACPGAVVDGLSGDFTSSKMIRTDADGKLVVVAKTRSSAANGVTVSVTVRIGNGTAYVHAAWTVRTLLLTPYAPYFVFTNVLGATRNTVYTSNKITLYYLEPNYEFTVTTSDPTVLVDAGTLALTGNYESSKTVTTTSLGRFELAVQMMSSNLGLAATSVVITVGNGNTTWTVTTKDIDTTPTLLSIPNLNNVKPNAMIDSNVVKVTDMEPSYSFTITAIGDGGIKVGTTAVTGDWAKVQTVTTATDGSFMLAAQVMSSPVAQVATKLTVSAGTKTYDWYVTTRLGLLSVKIFSEIPAGGECFGTDVSLSGDRLFATTANDTKVLASRTYFSEIWGQETGGGWIYKSSAPVNSTYSGEMSGGNVVLRTTGTKHILYSVDGDGWTQSAALDVYGGYTIYGGAYTVYTSAGASSIIDTMYAVADVKLGSNGATVYTKTGASWSTATSAYFVPATKNVVVVDLALAPGKLAILTAATVDVYKGSGQMWIREGSVSLANSTVVGCTRTTPYGGVVTGKQIVVSKDGETIAIGEILRNEGTAPVLAYCGVVYVLRFGGGVWKQEAILHSQKPKAILLFGASLAISDDGTTIAVGSNRGNAVDPVHVFTRTGDSWANTPAIEFLLPYDGNQDPTTGLFTTSLKYGGGFGRSIAMSATTIAVGASEDTEKGLVAGVGAVYMYNRD